MSCARKAVLLARNTRAALRVAGQQNQVPQRAHERRAVIEQTVVEGEKP